MHKGLTASVLYKKSNRNIIDDIVRAQLSIIDSAILEAHQAGRSELRYTLPTVFTIGTMSNVDAQICIYHDLLQLYKLSEPTGKGFVDTYIDTAIKPTLVVRWVNGMTKDERNKKMDFIKHCEIANSNK